jgi:hypothetical protein
MRILAPDGANAKSYAVAIALITAFFVVICWNEMRPTPNPTLFSIVAALLALLIAIFGWPADRLNEYTVFTAAGKDDTSLLD